MSIFKTLIKGNPMINLKTGLIIFVSTISLSLAACSKKQDEQVPAETATSSATVSEPTAVTSIEVAPDMIDAAPLEQEGSATSEATTK